MQWLFNRIKKGDGAPLITKVTSLSTLIMMNEYITKLKEKFKQMKEVDLPPALTRLKTMRLMIGISIITISVIAAILLKSVGILIGLIVGLYMLIAAIKTDYDYVNDTIKEYELVCISTSKRRYGTNVVLDIVFCDDNGATYKFNYGNKKGVFYENLRYKLYINQNNPEYIVAYQQL